MAEWAKLTNVHFEDVSFETLAQRDPGEPFVALAEPADRAPERALAIHTQLARDRHHRQSG